MKKIKIFSLIGILTFLTYSEKEQDYQSGTAEEQPVFKQQTTIDSKSGLNS